jgi:hypothetical protein
MININCIYDENYDKVNEFLQNNSGLDYINYQEIYTKLEKNDIYSKKPTDLIISTYIFKQFEKFLIEKESKEIFYVLKNLDPCIFENLRDILVDFTNEKIRFNLYTYTKRKRIKQVKQILIDETSNI